MSSDDTNNPVCEFFALISAPMTFTKSVQWLRRVQPDKQWARICKRLFFLDDGASIADAVAKAKYPVCTKPMPYTGADVVASAMSFVTVMLVTLTTFMEAVNDPLVPPPETSQMHLLVHAWLQVLGQFMSYYVFVASYYKSSDQMGEDAPTGRHPIDTSMRERLTTESDFAHACATAQGMWMHRHEERVQLTPTPAGEVFGAQPGAHLLFLDIVHTTNLLMLEVVMSFIPAFELGVAPALDCTHNGPLRGRLVRYLGHRTGRSPQVILRSLAHLRNLGWTLMLFMSNVWPHAFDQTCLMSFVTWPFVRLPGLLGNYLDQRVSSISFDVGWTSCRDAPWVLSRHAEAVSRWCAWLFRDVPELAAPARYNDPSWYDWLMTRPRAVDLYEFVARRAENMPAHACPEGYYIVAGWFTSLRHWPGAPPARLVGPLQVAASVIRSAFPHKLDAFTEDEFARTGCVPREIVDRIWHHLLCALTCAQIAHPLFDVFVKVIMVTVLKGHEHVMDPKQWHTVTFLPPRYRAVVSFRANPDSPDTKLANFKDAPCTFPVADDQGRVPLQLALTLVSEFLGGAIEFVPM